MPFVQLHDFSQGSAVEYVPLSLEPENDLLMGFSLTLLLREEWAKDYEDIEVQPIASDNTYRLLKVWNKRDKDGSLREDFDSDALLIRAYYASPGILVDRLLESANHEALVRQGLAPAMLARFENGVAYGFVPGRPATPEDLRKPEIYKPIARRMAEWHARMPFNPAATGRPEGKPDVMTRNAPDPALAGPNLWAILLNWMSALPTSTNLEVERRTELLGALGLVVKELSYLPGLGPTGMVFSHCDLRCENIIILPKPYKDAPESVVFIDYKYAMPAPAAYDIANHFSEWAGFGLDHSLLPTRAERRSFIAEYVRTYSSFVEGIDEAWEVEKLLDEVDCFRGMPGLFWGVWALHKLSTSNTNYDYLTYAEDRLCEFYDWRDEHDGNRLRTGLLRSGREMRWLS